MATADTWAILIPTDNLNCPYRRWAGAEKRVCIYNGEDDPVICTKLNCPLSTEENPNEDS